MDAVDSYIPDAERDIDKPFLMPIEDVFTIKGRGTVATGRIERGRVKVGEEIEIVGIHPNSTKTVVTGIEMFHKDMDECQAGDNVGALLRGVKREDVVRGQVLWPSPARSSRTPSSRRRSTSSQGRGRTSHAVPHRLPPAVLHAHDRRHGRGQAP